jgi:hypothetical protein
MIVCDNYLLIQLVTAHHIFRQAEVSAKNCVKSSPAAIHLSAIPLVVICER